MAFMYKIDSILLKLTYIHKDFYVDNIETYKTDDHTNIFHTIQVHVSDLKEYQKEISSELTFQKVEIKGNMKHIYHIEHKEMKAYVNHDISYKNVHIHLHSTYPYSLPRLEYVMTGMYFLEIAMFHGYFPFHATAIKLHDEVILITAPSGTGKSTHAKYWLQSFDDVSIMNDDKPLLKIKDNRIMAYGSPFSGEHRMNTNISLPVKAIIVLNRGLKNTIDLYPKDKIIPMLVKASMIPKTDDMWNEHLQTIEKMYDEIPVYNFFATHDKSAATYLRHVLEKDMNK